MTDKRIQKKSYQVVDQSLWSSEQRETFQNAKNEFERENILYNISQAQNNSHFEQEILQSNKNSKKPAPIQPVDNFEKLSDQSDDQLQNLSSEEGEYKENQKEIPTQINQIPMEDDPLESAIRNITLKRDQLSFLLLKNYYEEIIQGSFVRYQEPSTKSYLLGQIVSIVEGEKAYSLGQTQTYKLIKIKIASIIKVRQVVLVSNTQPTKMEYITWLKTMEEQQVTKPHLEDLIEKDKQLRKAKETKLDERQVQEIIKTRVEKILNVMRNVDKNFKISQDIGIYLSFIENQIKKEEGKMDSVEEQIAEMKETHHMNQEEKVKKYELENTIKLTKVRLEQLKEIRKKIFEIQRQKEQKERKVSEHQIKMQEEKVLIDRGWEQKQQSQKNLQLMKQLDNKYEDFYTQFNVDNFDQSEKIKQKFVQLHDFSLDIDFKENLWNENEI